MESQNEYNKAELFAKNVPNDSKNRFLYQTAHAFMGNFRLLCELMKQEETIQTWTSKSQEL